MLLAADAGSRHLLKRQEKFFKTLTNGATSGGQASLFRILVFYFSGKVRQTINVFLTNEKSPPIYFFPLSFAVECVEGGKNAHTTNVSVDTAAAPVLFQWSGFLPFINF